MLDQKDLELIAEIVERVTSPMKSDIKVLQGDMRSMKLTLENETNRNISIIAEGHLDLMILSILVDTFFSRDITDYAASFKVS